MSTDTVVLDQGAVPAEAVGPLRRGVAVLRALTDAGEGQTPSALARRVGLARASLDRIVTTLAALGYVRVDRREVTLAPPLAELGNAYLRSAGVPGLLAPLAQELSERLDEVVTLTVPDDDGAFLVAEAVRPRRLVIVCHVGDRLPIDRCAVGALYAATWNAEQWERFRAGHVCVGGPDSRFACAEDLRVRAEQARSRGWAPDDQWMEPGLVVVGLPVHRPNGTLACTINVLSFTSRHATAAELAEQVLPAARESVRRMEEVLRTAPAATDGATDVVRRTEPSPGVVESLARGLSVLTAFAARRPELTIADLARLTGLPRATVRRALITLEYEGFVAQSGGRYRPRPTVLSLGYPVLSRLTLAQIAQPHLEALSARVGESVSLAVLHSDTEITYRARAAAAERLTTVDLHIGTRLPAYVTSLGRVLLAALPPQRRAEAVRAADPIAHTRHTVTDPDALLALLRQVESNGYALVDEELEVGLRSLAVPVLGQDGRTLAAVNVAMRTGRGTVADCLAEILPHLRAAADDIRRDVAAVGAFRQLTLA